MLLVPLLLAPAAGHATSPGPASPGSEVAGPTLPPSPASGAPVIGSGDSRSDGEGPGLVGSPVAIALGVVVLGFVTAVGTLVVLRLARSGRG